MLNNEEFVSKIRELNPNRLEIFVEGPAIEEKRSPNS